LLIIQRVVVGAPKTKNNSNFNASDDTPGMVYSCPWKKSCEELPVQKINYETAIRGDTTVTEQNSDAMLGSTLDVHLDKLLVCDKNVYLISCNKIFVQTRLVHLGVMFAVTPIFVYLALVLLAQRICPPPFRS